MEKQEAVEVLGLQAGYSEDEVAAAYKRLVKLCHPDTGGTAYLFRKISEARDALKNKQPSEAARSSRNQGAAPPKAKKEERKPTWREVVLDPSFYVPYEKFLKIVNGQEQTVRFGKYTVVIDEHDLWGEFIKTKIPVTVEVRTWENMFKRIFGKPNIVTKEMTVGNKFPFSHDFALDLTVRLHTKSQKYYKLTVKILDQEFIKSGRCLTACQSQGAKKHARISGLCMDLCTYFVSAD